MAKKESSDPVVEPTPNTPVQYDPAPVPTEPPNPPTPPPPEDLLASLANAPRMQALGNQATEGARISRTDLENSIRQAVQECFDFSRAYLAHVSFVDENDQVQHRSFNYFMPIENLEVISGEVQKFLNGLRPEMPEQLLPKAPEKNDG